MAQGAHTGNGAAEARCRDTCVADAASRPSGATSHAVHACSIRCAAGAAFQQQQSHRGTAEATGRGRPAAPLAQAVTPTAPTRAGASPAHTPNQQGIGVVYVGRPGSGAFGISVGKTDRIAAHRDASVQCNASGHGCRVVSEFTAACGAVAQGVVPSQGTLFVTSDPSSYVTTSASAGSAATREAAGRDALVQCRTRDPRANCRVAAITCGTQG